MFIWAAVVGIAVYVVVQWVLSIVAAFTVDDGSCDAATTAVLASSSAPDATVHGPSLPLVRALEACAVEDDEGRCADQMRKIVAAGHLSYSTLIDAPETLLRCSPGFAGSNGALWTRFTVQYNLYAGSVIAMGTDEQRTELLASQRSGELGCFAFTEKGAGVLSGAGVETTAHYDSIDDSFVIHSPTPSSTKNWISQGLYAERAVILADLELNGESIGPHLFWAAIADRKGDGIPTPRKGVTVGSLPAKTALLGLDNAEITFQHFRVPRSALLGRFGTVEGASSDNDKTVVYTSKLPAGVSRILDLLISRLLTGRIVLSEATLAHVMSRVRHSWKYATARELWRGRHPKGRMMAEMPLIRGAFRDYGRTTSILQAFIADTRENVADAIRGQVFSNDLIEATCMCKFLGTGFGVDCISAIRKVMGARAMQADSMLGAESFIPNATSAAEGDNTVMELKIVQDIVRGRTAQFPLKLMARIATDPRGRIAIVAYITSFGRAMVLQKKAMQDGQLLRAIAWSRAHMRVIDVWMAQTVASPEKRAWLESYERVILQFPVRTQV